NQFLQADRTRRTKQGKQSVSSNGVARQPQRTQPSHSRPIRQRLQTSRLKDGAIDEVAGVVDCGQGEFLQRSQRRSVEQGFDAPIADAIRWYPQRLQVPQVRRGDKSAKSQHSESAIVDVQSTQR